MAGSGPQVVDALPTQGLFAVSLPMLNTIFYLLLLTVHLAEINLVVVVAFA